MILPCWLADRVALRAPFFVVSAHRARAGPAAHVATPARFAGASPFTFTRDHPKNIELSHELFIIFFDGSVYFDGSGSGAFLFGGSAAAYSDGVVSFGGSGAFHFGAEIACFDGRGAFFYGSVDFDGRCVLEYGSVVFDGSAALEYGSGSLELDGRAVLRGGALVASSAARA